MILYHTVAGPGYSEQVIERSRFLTHVSPAETREEAERFLSEITKQYRDATHNVPAFVIGDHMEYQWASDNGEPQGTSGAPMVQLLVREGITNVAIVVTRYFGGIKLGTGGLVRAYSSSARQGLLAAGIAAVEEKAALQCTAEYPAFSRIQNAFAKDPDAIGNIQYLEKVSFDFYTEEAELPRAEKHLQELSNGRIVFNGQKKIRLRIPAPDLLTK